MSDSGKHSAIRQTGDGSFEIVFDRSGLQEVSEEDYSIGEVTAPEPRGPRTRPSNRVIAFSIGGVAGLLILAAIGWVALSPSRTLTSEVDVVPGFRPYGGGAEGREGAAPPSRKERSAAAAAALARDDAEHPEPTPADEITESEPGWELTEVNEPPPAVVEVEPAVVEPVEPVEPVEEVAEQEVDEPRVVELNEGTELPDETDARVRAFSGRRGIKSMRGTDIGRSLQAPRVPALNANPLATQRLKSLPIRGLQPDSISPDEQSEEVEVVEESEEVVEDDAIEEEVVEE